MRCVLAGLACGVVLRTAELDDEKRCCCPKKEVPKYVCVDFDTNVLLEPSQLGQDEDVQFNSDPDASVQRSFHVATHVKSRCSGLGVVDVNETSTRRGVFAFQRRLPLAWRRYTVPDDPEVMKKYVQVDDFTAWSKYVPHIVVEGDAVYAQVFTAWSRALSDEHEKALPRSSSFFHSAMTKQCTQYEQVGLVKHLRQTPTGGPGGSTWWCEEERRCTEHGAVHACGFDQPRGELYKRVGRVGSCVTPDVNLLGNRHCPGDTYHRTSKSLSWTGGFRFCDCSGACGD